MSTIRSRLFILLNVSFSSLVLPPPPLLVVVVLSEGEPVAPAARADSFPVREL
jgi:hypothetical protein